MPALLPLAGCFLFGVVVNLTWAVPQRLIHLLNAWILRIALPALILELLPRLAFTRELWFLVAAMWVVFAGGWLVAALAGARLGWSRARIGAIALVAGLGNTAFTGYPLIEALRGAEALPLAVVADQFGCFIALATGGVILASWYGGDRTHPAKLVARIACFPPFLACLAGLAAGQFGGWPTGIQAVLHPVGATLSPLALLSIGLQLRLRVGAEAWQAIGAGLAWKLAAAPALVYVLGLAAGVRDLPLVVGVLQAAMGPMVSAAILADEHGLDATVANAMLAIGVVLSLATVPAIDALL
ncbi:MAG: AEC family transporter [Steroidobacteraceae bacterium]